jgi:hypothetical protein
MNGQLGISGFSDDLMDPAVGVLGGGEDGESGPGSYDAVVTALRGLADDAGLLARLGRVWDGRTFASRATRPLLLLAALRERALTHPGSHPLAPELLMDAVAPELLPRLRAALDDPELDARLRDGQLDPVDPARAALWGLGALFLRLPHRGFDLVERGTPAGLGLVVDRTAIPFRFGTHLLQGFDFPSPELRLAFHAAPLDLDEPTVRWLRACIWPSERDRLTRLEATLTHRRMPWRGDSPAPEVRARGDLAWPALEEELRATPGVGERPLLLLDATTPFEGPPALPPEDGADGPYRLLREIPGAVWLHLVRTGHGGGRALRIDAVLFRTGAWQRVTLGETGFHSATVTLDLTGPSRLSALFQVPA